MEDEEFLPIESYYELRDLQIKKHPIVIKQQNM